MLVVIPAIFSLISGMVVVPNMEESPSRKGSLPVLKTLDKAPLMPRPRRLRKQRLNLAMGATKAFAYVATAVS